MSTFDKESFDSMRKDPEFARKLASLKPQEKAVLTEFMKLQPGPLAHGAMSRIADVLNVSRATVSLNAARAFARLEGMRNGWKK